MSRRSAMLSAVGVCFAVVLGAPSSVDAAKGLTLTNAVVDLEASPPTVTLHELDDAFGAVGGQVWQVVDGVPVELIVVGWSDGSIEAELASAAPGDYLLTVLTNKKKLGLLTLTVPVKVELLPVPLPVAQGGTGAEDAAGARANLGVVAGPHTTDTDTTCDGAACDGTSFSNLQWANLEGLPTTTKGDLLVQDDADVVRLPVGTDGQVLVADSSQPTGLRWASSVVTVSAPLPTAGPASTTVECPPSTTLIAGGITVATPPFPFWFDNWCETNNWVRIELPYTGVPHTSVECGVTSFAYTNGFCDCTAICQ